MAKKFRLGSVDFDPVCPVENPMNTYVTKGSRVAVGFFQADPIGSKSIAGCMVKTTATRIAFTGTVAHVRGDHPTDPTKVVVFVTPDAGYDGQTMTPAGCTCTQGHIAVDPAHVTAVNG